MAEIFPNSTIHYVSLPHIRYAETPKLSKSSVSDINIPYLNLHTDLVKAYWSTARQHRAWFWLEDDFSVMRRWGFQFRRGDMAEYVRTLLSIAPQIITYLLNLVKRTSASAVCVYGRGHWLMNVASLAASACQIPLYVIERGILPDSYIVDVNVPYTAISSCFRKSWITFKTISDKPHYNCDNSQVSRWDLYAINAQEVHHQRASSHSDSVVLVGQCKFDFNCLEAPFSAADQFIEYCIENLPSSWKKANFIYRPHPLSIEEHPMQGVRTKYGDIPIDISSPQTILVSRSPMCSWNSTLCLEARLYHGSDAIALDPNCYYTSINLSDENEKATFLSYLNEISVLNKGHKS